MSARSQPVPGDEAPDLELLDRERSPVRPSGLRGRPVVLYFSPRAKTPGRTTQACGIRDRFAAYEAAGAPPSSSMRTTRWPT